MDAGRRGLVVGGQQDGCDPAGVRALCELGQMRPNETAARASEILDLNVEDLDLEQRRAPVRSKGGDTEFVYWHTGTAHLLPRLLRLVDGTTRTSGPLFLASRPDNHRSKGRCRYRDGRPGRLNATGRTSRPSWRSSRARPASHPGAGGTARTRNPAAVPAGRRCRSGRRPLPLAGESPGTALSAWACRPTPGIPRARPRCQGQPAARRVRRKAHHLHLRQLACPQHEQRDAPLQLVLTAVPVRDQRLYVEDDCACRKLLDAAEHRVKPRSALIPGSHKPTSTQQHAPGQPPPSQDHRPRRAGDWRGFRCWRPVSSPRQVWRRMPCCPAARLGCPRRRTSAPRAGRCCEARRPAERRGWPAHSPVSGHRGMPRARQAARGARRGARCYPAVTFLRSSCPVIWMERGLACSCTGMVRVRTPAL